MTQVRTYADGIGPEKRLVIPVSREGIPAAATDLVARAHAAGLLVHAWTVRIDKEFLPAGYHGNAAAEFDALRAAGVDGVFTDFPDVAANAYKKP